jgi:hypothetical protein
VPEAARPHFFISFTGADRVWAEWIAWQLEEAEFVRQGISGGAHSWYARLRHENPFACDPTNDVAGKFAKHEEDAVKEY